MDYTSSVKFFNRGPSEYVRLVFFVLLSLLLLFIDARFQYLKSTRNILSVLIYPVQRLASLPPELWHETSEYLTLQVRLVQENQQLHEQHATDAAQLQQMADLQAENTLLRSLLEVRQRLGVEARLSKVVYAEHDLSLRKLMLDLGEQSGVQPGQAVIDSGGVVGQITHVYPLLSEVTLITNKDHETPVQIVRNGLRAIMYGTGESHGLEPRFMPTSADIQAGDVLVTSGIDGTYPPGLPVARVESVERDPAYPFARIKCVPATGVNNQRWLFVLSSAEKLPALPERGAEDASTVNKGKRTKLKTP